MPTSRSGKTRRASCRGAWRRGCAEAADLLRSMADNRRRRRFGDAIRLEVEERCPQAVRELLRTQLQLAQEDVYPVDGPIGVGDLISVLTLDLPSLKDAPILPACR